MIVCLVLLFETLHNYLAVYNHTDFKIKVRFLPRVFQLFQTLYFYFNQHIKLNGVLISYTNKFKIASLERMHNNTIIIVHNYCYLQKLQVPSMQHFPYCWSCVFEYHRLYQNHRFLELSPQLPRANCQRKKKSNCRMK